MKLAEYTVRWYAVTLRNPTPGAAIHAARPNDEFTMCNRTIDERSNAVFDLEHDDSCASCRHYIDHWVEAQGMVAS